MFFLRKLIHQRLCPPPNGHTHNTCDEPNFREKKAPKRRMYINIISKGHQYPQLVHISNHSITQIKIKVHVV